jgi:Glycosyl transferase family 2
MGCSQKLNSGREERQSLAMPERLSFVIPAYNSELTLSRAVASCRTSNAFEVIVVDDGSSDQTAALAESLGCVVVRQANGGAAAARRAGVQRVEGDRVILLDADDVVVPEGVKESLRALRDDGNASCALGVTVGVSPTGSESIFRQWNRPVTVAELVNRGFAPSPPASIMWRTVVLREVMFGVMPALWPRHAEDFELLIRGAAFGAVAQHPHVSAHYSMSGGKSSLDPLRSVRASEEIRAHYGRLFGISYTPLSTRQARGLAKLRAAKEHVAAGAHVRRFIAVVHASVLHPRLVGRLAIDGIRSRLLSPPIHTSATPTVSSVR